MLKKSKSKVFILVQKDSTQRWNAELTTIERGDIIFKKIWGKSGRNSDVSNTNVLRSSNRADLSLLTQLTFNSHLSAFVSNKLDPPPPAFSKTEPPIFQRKPILTLLPCKCVALTEVHALSMLCSSNVLYLDGLSYFG